MQVGGVCALLSRKEVLFQPLQAGSKKLPVRGPSSLAMHLMHHPGYAMCIQVNQVSEDVRTMAWPSVVVEIWGAKAAPFLCGKTGSHTSPKALHSRQHVSTLP